jgi:hypothetical protein
MFKLLDCEEVGMLAHRKAKERSFHCTVGLELPSVSKCLSEQMV